jgi:hypothetical protein
VFHFGAKSGVVLATLNLPVSLCGPHPGLRTPADSM